MPDDPIEIASVETFCLRATVDSLPVSSLGSMHARNGLLPRLETGRLSTVARRQNVSTLAISIGSSGNGALFGCADFNDLSVLQIDQSVATIDSSYADLGGEMIGPLWY